MLSTLLHDLVLQLSNPFPSALIALSLLFVLILGSLLHSPNRSLPKHSSVRSQDIVGKLGNLDFAPARRLVRSKFQAELQKLNHPFFLESLDGVKAEEYYKVNSRGIEIFTRSWLPISGVIKATVFICHGYGDTCTFFFEGVARKLAKAGYAVFGMDYPGFGMSSGLHGYIPDFKKIVDDVIENYSGIKGRPEFKELPCFLFGESMGGAVALMVHLKQTDAWNGAVLVAPMCKLAPDMYPPWYVIQILIFLSYLIPTAKLVPDKNLADLAFQDLEKRKQTAYNVAAYKDKPRLRTALEMLRATDEISSKLDQVSLPLLILHGELDVVTEPSVSRSLHEQAKSADKTLHIFKNAWHSILEGESDEVILQVFDQIRSWLDSHVK